MQKVIERIINLLAFLLTAGRPVTAEQIRDTVAGYDQDNDEAFRRMFERDKDLLRSLGVPLQMQPTDVWEVEFGYVIPPEDYQLADPGLTDEERAALWMAAQTVRLGGQPSGPEAMFKLGGAPMSASGEPLAADLGPEVELLGELFSAITEKRRTEFGYRDRPRRVYPYGMVHRRGHWYLVGAAPDDADPRAYRVDRMVDLELSAEAGLFSRPQGFRASQFLAEAPWEAGEQDMQAVVRFDAEAAWWARRQLPSSAAITEEADGSLVATLRVANPDSFVGWLLGFVDQAEVLEPPELRRLVVARVKAVS